ncbi:MAG TPA: hypothetical protein VK459_13230 [Polyangiaceae bacterium]|nr:hypothetical protein [Polyangiaceae bacterium]
MTDTLLTNARLVDPSAEREGRGHLLIRDGLIADGAQSLIREQVEMGVAVRMAVLEALAGREDGE